MAPPQVARARQFAERALRGEMDASIAKFSERVHCRLRLRADLRANPRSFPEGKKHKKSTHILHRGRAEP